MPNPQFTRPWHGVPREAIHWNPTILEDACIGCGTCVTGCSRLVYRFDFQRKKPVVVDPLNCMVGCTTCANTCPAHAIEFPPIESVLALESRETVRHAVEDDLLARREVLGASTPIPAPDRIVRLRVAERIKSGPDVLRLRLETVTAGECFCEFSPGQYLELWQPDSSFMARAYSIANSPRGDGSVELHVRRVEGGRFTSWAFDGMQVGDILKARGPLGNFTMRSRPETPLLFAAGGTGLAPILALLRQQAQSQPQRDLVLVWGAKRAEDFYALDEVNELRGQLPHLRVVMVTETATPPLPAGDRLTYGQGTVIDLLARDATLLDGRDIYAAGPPGLLRAIGHWLDQIGVARERVHLDSFGT